MAEGGNFSRSIEDGSDIVFEFECTPCAADGSRFEAFQFCPTCHEFLCNICIKYHQRLSKSHKLLPAASTKQLKTEPLAKNKPAAAKCHFHPDRDIEMYCGTHDMVYCSLCIAKEHRSCSNVDEVEDSVHKADPSRLQQLVVDVGRVNKELLDMKQEKSKDLKLIKTKRSDLLKEIDELRKEMNDHLDSIERKIKAELDKELTKLEQEIREDITAADDFVTTTNERKTDLGHSNDGRQTFIVEKLGQKVISDVEAFLVKANTTKHPILIFERNKRLFDGIKMADNIGKIVRKCHTSHQVKSRKYVVKSSIPSNVTIDTDNTASIIIGMCQLQNNTIMMADFNNTKLKVLDDSLNVKDFIQPYKPFGICTISPTEVALKESNSIKIIHVGQTLSPGKVIKIDTLKSCSGNGIAFCAGNLWTFGEKIMCIYSMSGCLLKTVYKDPSGQKIFNIAPRSIAVSNDETKVYVTAGDRVVVFDKNGDVINVLRDQQLRGRQGVCVTEDGIVLVSGFNSKNVVMFDRDGNSLGELVSNKEMISNPWSLCYDKNKCRLLVGFHANMIQIYELC